MSAARAVVTADSPTACRSRWFFLVLVLAMFAVIAAIESPRFFLVGFYRPPDFASGVIHIHVAIVATWMLVLLAQVEMGRVGRVEWHRRLGVAGMVLVVLMLVFGLLATADMLRREPDALHRSIVPTTQILLFAFFAGLAYVRRRDRDAHRSLMVLAMVDPMFGVLAPWMHRYLFAVERWANFSWVILLLLAGYDLWTRRSLHPVTRWGGLLLIAVQEVRVPLGDTAAWTAIATWMHGWGV
jgi:hypothetical protein